MNERGRQLVRVLQVKATLEGGRRWTLQQMAERFDVTTRTIRRDFDALQRAGVPICHEGDVGVGIQNSGHWWIAR